MGANTGNRGQMDDAQRQQAMEGQAMRRRAMEQQAQDAPTQEQGVVSSHTTGTHGSRCKYGSHARDAFWD